MNQDEQTVLAINSLWEPVYPFMAEHLLTSSRVTGGRFLELGPFSGGLALNILWKNEDFLATVCDSSAAVLRWTEERAAVGGYVSRLTTLLAPLDPVPAPAGTFDLVAVRGAFFFLTVSLLSEIHRVLRPGGYAWIGGGYGKTTPPSVIAPIADLSRELNARIGKQWKSMENVRDLVSAAGLSQHATVSAEGGLWIEVRA